MLSSAVDWRVAYSSRTCVTRNHPGREMRSGLEQSYDLFPRIEQAFHERLDESLHPQWPDLLYDLVGDFGPAREALP